MTGTGRAPLVLVVSVQRASGRAGGVLRAWAGLVVDQRPGACDIVPCTVNGDGWRLDGFEVQAPLYFGIGGPGSFRWEMAEPVYITPEHGDRVLRLEQVQRMVAVLHAMTRALASPADLPGQLLRAVRMLGAERDQAAGPFAAEAGDGDGWQLMTLADLKRWLTEQVAAIVTDGAVAGHSGGTTHAGDRTIITQSPQQISGGGMGTLAGDR